MNFHKVILEKEGEREGGGREREGGTGRQTDRQTERWRGGFT